MADAKPKAVVKTVGPKVPTAASASAHKAGGGNVKITDSPVKFNVAPKIPTASSAAQHKAGGGNVKITDAPVKFNVAPKIPTAAAAARGFTCQLRRGGSQRLLVAAADC
jgi:hypothetical protein